MIEAVSETARRRRVALLDVVASSAIMVVALTVVAMMVRRLVMVIVGVMVAIVKMLRHHDRRHWWLCVHISWLLICGLRVAAVRLRDDGLAVCDVWLRHAGSLGPAAIAMQPIIMVAATLPCLQARTGAQRKEQKATQACIFGVAHEHVIGPVAGKRGVPSETRTTT